MKPPMNDTLRDGTSPLKQALARWLESLVPHRAGTAGVSLR
jgi:hypothetical protein